ncbi:helix-turn-helix transcriptional regulator [Comamonas aquatica]|uniref:helix-turn-helix domain-containing protein n=2 Tax=Comamonas aquatica TaxID=225991 RepID=UPI003132BB58
MHKSLYTQENKVLLQLLCETRKMAGLTQVQLGALLDEDQTFVSKVESGVRRLDLIELNAWCIAVGLSLPTFIARYERGLGRAV